MNQNIRDIEDIKIIVRDIGEDKTREATPDIELSENLTHGRRSQASAVPLIHQSTHVSRHCRNYFCDIVISGITFILAFFCIIHSGRII